SDRVVDEPRVRRRAIDDELGMPITVEVLRYWYVAVAAPRNGQTERRARKRICDDPGARASLIDCHVETAVAVVVGWHRNVSDATYRERALPGNKERSPALGRPVCTALTRRNP